ncbi:APC family permease [Frankia sp. AgPm24]|uniref:APC family permease n=1 Tax=Frankia sp. AgPm24 TaxID=631128 RepID=UPI00200F113A|nr:APC family permease [Frankia sp. AgPm24]MCK9922060.1 APC family permease [Frankia sp. AgPm24]
MVIGLAAMIGAGVFTVFAPAARVAGAGLLPALGVAAVVAYCNATSSARLAARYPSSGGTYVYGRARLGDLWGYLAGVAFVVGKTASCAAMALGVGGYAWPAHPHLIAVAAVVLLTGADVAGAHRGVALGRVLVGIALVVLAVVVVVCLTSATFQPARLRLRAASDAATPSAGGVLRAAGLLFFAFAGYARLATLGEEVRDPARTIPRAVLVALAITLVVYLGVAVAVLGVLGPAALGGSGAPLVDAVRAAGAGALAPLVRVGAVVAASGSLLALLLGVSRTTLAMARDRHLPRTLAVVSTRTAVPHHAQLTVGAVVAVAAGFLDLRATIGFSSFGVLVYYAVANASAWTLRPEEGRPPRWVPVCGLVGCLTLACTLPPGAVVAGLGMLAAGGGAYALTRRHREGPPVAVPGRSQ